MPCRAASRALTGCPCFPAMDACGRRTRKPPAGALSKEVRKPEAQRLRRKKAFPASRDFRTCRHTADTIHANPPRLILYKIFPMHTALPHTRRSDVRAVMCVMPTLPCVGYCLHGLRIAFRHSPHTVSSCAGCFIWSRQYTHQRHVGYKSAPRPIGTCHIPDAHIMRPRFLRGCLFIRPALSPRASLRFVYTPRV